MMKAKFSNKLFKIIFCNLLLLVIAFNENLYSKPIPPGSGEGDVPANILILLDSSASMQRTISSGVAIRRPWDVVTDSNNDIIITMERRRGLMKINAADESRNGTFGRFRGRNRDGNCGNQDSSIRDANSLAISTNVLGRGSDDTIYIAEQRSDGGKVVVINNDGRCVDVIDRGEMGWLRPRALTIRTIGGEDHLLVAGWFWVGGVRGGVYSRNLTTGISRLCDPATTMGGDMDRFASNIWSIAMDDGNFLYMGNWNTRNIEGYAIQSDGNTYCPVDNGRDRHYVHDLNAAVGGTSILPAVDIEIDPDDGDVMWLSSYARDNISKATIVNDTTVTLNATKGSWGRGDTTDDSDVNSIDPYGLHVTSDHVFVGVRNPKILQFNNDATITWIDAIGGSVTTRFIGARNAIKAIMNDSSLTAGANYGYGHWNSGRGQRWRWANTGQNTCHHSPPTPRGRIRNSNIHCEYWDGWTGSHPEGRSTLCNKDSCIMVGVSPRGHELIPAALDRTRMAWGTDGNAFAKMAWGYFTSPQVDIIDTESPCQLNYVIMISDGAFTHEAQARPIIEKLRTDHKVKTIVVGYGGGLARSRDRFIRMARAGSCDDATGASSDCMPVIWADTPQSLTSQLQSKIQQIIADRLSFTAPAITATIQEGGSLYQAQFDFKMHNEWEGHLIRKSIKIENGNPVVCHELDKTKCPDNWDAAVAIKAQAQRKIWTVLPGSDYLAADWNNWTADDDNFTHISQLFDLLGNEVVDYHNTTSECSKNDAGVSKTAAQLAALGIEDGNEDDIKGLINFIRGTDYFAYGGCSQIANKRAHVLGDIYHSQIVEIGAPKGNYDFNRGNEEAYFRSTHNYASFASTHKNRRRIIYAGANDGMLHAINATDGSEQWAFVPPFIAAKLPTVVNKGLDGKLPGRSGGSNAIFGVDGSPVVHDMYIRGLNQNGEWEDGKKWRTILIIPYGRGGAGFSVLDVTYPDAGATGGPLHMFSIFNDTVQNRVLIANHKGVIREYPYIPESISWDQSREAAKVVENQNTAEDADTDRGDDLTTEQDNIVACQTNADAAGSFADNGTNACYRGKTFTFELATPEGVTIEANDFRYYVGDNETPLTPVSATESDGIITITFPGTTPAEDLFINNARSDLVDESEETSEIRLTINPSLAGVRDNNYKYDYSKLGETWSTPRVFRIPDYDNLASDYRNDKYVFVMGGGKGSSINKIGSALFVVNLEDAEHPGAIYGSEKNKGPIQIADTIRSMTYPNGSDIDNSVPASPVVITPDNIIGVNWRGAMVYVNDLEGKITKINLTNSRKGLFHLEATDTKMFHQKTILTLAATVANGRYSYHSMDAGIGRDTRKFWLFGATGHYERINDTKEMTNDNIMYGIKDDYRIFKQQGESVPPLKYEVDYHDWLSAAFLHSNSALVVEEPLRGCVDVTGDTAGVRCPSNADKGWMYYLNRDEAGTLTNQHKKSSATPRVYKGNVYFPIYMPTQSDNKCNLGRAYICSADDECGTNNSTHLSMEGQMPDDDACFFVREGILSELVVFGDTLFGNIATKAETQEDTLVQVLSGAGQVSTYRRSWRENF